MNITKTAVLMTLCGILSVFAAGCMLGDRVAVRTVSLNLSTEGSHNKTNLSVSDPQAQDALQIIDGVLNSHGFHRNPLTAEDQARGLVAFYGICGVSLTENRLDVGFVEAHRRASSASVKKISNELKDKLRERFGAGKVKVER
jgi:hypothetical protein